VRIFGIQLHRRTWRPRC